MAIKYPTYLQLFAQEKTEKATPKKRQDSRKKGQVAKSNEVSTSLILLFVCLILFFIGEWLYTNIHNIIRMVYTEYMLQDLSEANTSELFQTLTLESVKIVAPIMAASMVAGIFANYLQVGFLFTTDPLKMKLERINPLKGAKRIFALRALVELIKSVFKITLVATISYFILWSKREEILMLSQKTVGHSLTFIGGLTLQLGLIIAIILLFLSIFDYLYQKYEFEKGIRMSKQDIKDERKKAEGDPLIKRRIKERQMQMAMRRMMQEVPKADVVITNPTHFAVAIQYDEESMEAPTVVAKGADHVAFKIKEVAKEHHIVTMENKPLARALYQQVEIGEPVPEELYKAVAEVLAYVYKVNGKVK